MLKNTLNLPKEYKHQNSSGTFKEDEILLNYIYPKLNLVELKNFKE